MTRPAPYAVLTLDEATMQAFHVREVEPAERDSLADALRDAEDFGRRYGVPARLVTVDLMEYGPEPEDDRRIGSTTVATARLFYRALHPEARS